MNYRNTLAPESIQKLLACHQVHRPIVTQSKNIISIKNITSIISITSLKCYVARQKMLRNYNLLVVDISLNNGAFVQVLHMDKFRVYHSFDKSPSIKRIG